jgi:hypothetical protein
MNRKNLMLFPILICYISFLYQDSELLKYTSVLLCFANALMTGKESFEKKDAALLQAAMFVTVIADSFLLFTGYYFLGVCLFCMVQLIYIIRHSRYSQVHLKTYCLSGAIFMLVAVIAVVSSGVSGKAIAIAGCLYAFLTLSSLHAAFGAAKLKRYPKRTIALINAGLWLLMLCDVNVALYNTIASNHITGLLIWFFYIPSQLLLSMSARK